MARWFWTCAVLLWVSLTQAQIKEFYLTCNQTDFEYIYDNYEQNIYIPATLEYNGTVWNNVSLRIRGDGSRQLPKKSLKLRFNEGAFVDGRTSLNINAEYQDKSYVQQYLASRLMKESGQVCFDAEHIRVHLNGSFLGLYLLVEPVNERFFQVRGMDPEGPTYKASLDGSCLSIFDQPQYHWDQETGPDVNSADLQQLIDELNETPQSEYASWAEEAFNREEMVNIIAMNILLSLGSTYYHNYFMHHDPASDKWMMLPWDMDKSLIYYGALFPYQRSSNVWMPDNPFHEKALSDDDLLADIRARISELNVSIFNISHVGPILDSIQNVISSSVAEDQTDNVTDLGFWEGELSFYESQFNARPAQSITQIDQWPRNFEVERLGSAEPGETVQLNWEPSTSPLSRPIEYRFRLADHLHLADSADLTIDNITSTSVTFQVPNEEGLYYYLVQAYDGYNYVKGFDTYNPLVVTTNVPELVINEINYHSSQSHVSGDWVEIHNPLTYEVNLTDWYLQDSQNDHIFVLPEEASIGPGQFVILATDSASFNYLNNINAPVYGGITFGFGNSGDHLRLFHPSGILVDEVFYSDTTPWPWQADGYGPTLELNNPASDNSLPQNWNAWENRLGTPGAPNYNETTVEETLAFSNLEVYPNPSAGSILTIELTTKDNLNLDVEILDITGKLLFRERLVSHIGINRYHIEPELKTSGVYLLKIVENENSISKKLIITKATN